MRKYFYIFFYFILNEKRHVILVIFATALNIYLAKIWKSYKIEINNTFRKYYSYKGELYINYYNLILIIIGTDIYIGNKCAIISLFISFNIKKLYVTF